MLRSLSREVTDIQKAEEERLLLQMDLLYENNTRLNGRLRGIVQELESETAFRIPLYCPAAIFAHGYNQALQKAHL